MRRISPTRFVLGLLAAIVVAPVALMLLLAIYTGIVGGPIQCERLQVPACLPAPR